LRGPQAGLWYSLYVVLDIFSRKIVGWRIETREDAELAEALIAESYAREGVQPHQRTTFCLDPCPKRLDTFRRCSQLSNTSSDCVVCSAPTIRFIQGMSRCSGSPHAATTACGTSVPSASAARATSACHRRKQALGYDLGRDLGEWRITTDERVVEGGQPS
jgi:hypothetical protein